MDGCRCVQVEYAGNDDCYVAGREDTMVSLHIRKTVEIREHGLRNAEILNHEGLVICHHASTIPGQYVLQVFYLVDEKHVRCRQYGGKCPGRISADNARKVKEAMGV